MDNLIEKCFGLNIFVLKLLWMYPSDENNSCVDDILACVKYILMTVPVPVLGLLSIILDENDAQRRAENAFVVAATGNYLLKFFPIIANRQRLLRCINYFQDEQVMVGTDTERRILRKTIKICRRNTKVYLAIFLDGYLVWSLKAFYMRSVLPVDVWLPFDIKKTPIALHCFIYIYVLAGVLYTVLAASVLDPLVGGLSTLATGELKILKYKIKHLGKNTSASFDDKKTSCKMYQNVTKCVYYHNMILNFVALCRETLSMMSFWQLSGSSLMICICCFELSIMTSFGINAVLVIYYILCMLAQILFYCYFGTILNNESVTLTDSVWLSKWHQLDNKSKKVLILLMERSRRPMILTAGKFMDLSLQTFTAIIKRSYSLLALLRSYG